MLTRDRVANVILAQKVADRMIAEWPDDRTYRGPDDLTLVFWRIVPLEMTGTDPDAAPAIDALSQRLTELWADAPEAVSKDDRQRIIVRVTMPPGQALNRLDGVDGIELLGIRRVTGGITEIVLRPRTGNIHKEGNKA